MRRIAVVLALLASPVFLGGCVQQIKASRVKSALMDGGLSEQLSDCMANRMASKLSIKQLRGLQKLSRAPRRSIPEFAAALRQNGDVDAIEVTISSAALCRTGLIR